ncbi:MAG TPA: glutathione transferase GstA [Aggregicoccus sp.]|nr:glutathione transferase GstA [Aggregicoccus sp.]
MKLFYSPGACSLSPHIVLSEAGLKADLVKVDLRAHKTEDGGDYYAINPKGYVPALQLDNGELLTEGPAIVQYLADLKPEAKLAPPNGTLERYRLQEWLTFIGTELHKTFSPLFNPASTEDVKSNALQRLTQRFELVAKHLEGKKFLLGEQFSVADAYLFVILNWSRAKAPDVAKQPVFAGYFENIMARPAVKAAMVAEGLKKA